METSADARVKWLAERSVRHFVCTHVCLLLILAAAGCLAQENLLTLVPLPPITAVIGRPFRQQLSAAGGVGSYSWRLAEGSGALPPGLMLDPKSGQISGMPTKAGGFRFRIVVSDSGGPPSTDVRTFTIEVPDALTLDWERAPHISQEGITGSVVVSNQTAHTVDLTVIIVAVNEVGKAFALAEQHFPLPAGMDSPVIPFGKNAVLPFGRYTLHADAVGEVASENQIYRTRKQTADDFVIKQQ